MVASRCAAATAREAQHTADEPTLRHAATRAQETRVHTYQSQPRVAELPSATVRSHHHKQARAPAPARALMSLRPGGEADGASASLRVVRRPSLPQLAPVVAAARKPQRQCCCGETMTASRSSRPRHSAGLLCCCAVDPGARSDCCRHQGFRSAAVAACCHPRDWRSASVAGCDAAALPGPSTFPSHPYAAAPLF